MGISICPRTIPFQFPRQGVWCCASLLLGLCPASWKRNVEDALTFPWLPGLVQRRVVLGLGWHGNMALSTRTCWPPHLHRETELLTQFVSRQVHPCPEDSMQAAPTEPSLLPGAWAGHNKGQGIRAQPQLCLLPSPAQSSCKCPLTHE